MSNSTDSLVGETFQVSVADGYGEYRVTDEFENVVRIEHVPDGRDNYTAPLLGAGCIITKANVVSALEFEKRYRR
jgi:hypothetical protein